MPHRIAILGTGLIGGSLGLAWTARRSDVHIIGFDRPEVLEAAEARGAIHEKAAAPDAAVRDADAVVLALPPATTLRMLDAIADALPPNALVTDVASVKQPVMDQAADVLPDSVRFAGGHPMAGAEHSGIDHADDLLFENAVYALCLPDDVETDALEDDYALLLDLVESTGARSLVVDAATHDRVAAAVSHLPQLLAIALVNTVAETDNADLALELAAGGFRDMTRIASSPFAMWRDILVGNESNIHDAVSHFTRTVQQLRNRLIAEDLEGLEDAFDRAAGTRADIPRDAKGFLEPLNDVFVRAADEPGVLHRITGVLLEADLNLKDVELQSFREGTGGTFRVAFDTESAAATATDVLNEAGFKARQAE